MRVVFSMAHAGHVRNFESTLRALAERGHETTVLLDRRGPEAGAVRLLDRLAVECPGLRVEAAPARPVTARAASALRVALDAAQLRRTGGGEAARDRAEARTRPPLGLIARAAPGRALLQRAERGLPRSPRLAATLARLAPDLLVVTPLVELGSPQVEVVRWGATNSVPVALAVASWDNLTMKGTIHTPPDRVLVWNDEQGDEAVQLHGLAPERIAVVGAAAWDRWSACTPSDRAAFCGAVGLDPARPYVLYLGSSAFLAPDEGQFVLDWLAGVRAGSPDPQTLVRPHPGNPLTAAQEDALRAAGGVAIQPGESPCDEDAFQAYFDAIHHSGAVVGINTSGLLEAALLGRRVLAPTPERYRATQLGTHHFRSVLASAGGPLEIAATSEEHREQLRGALADEPGNGSRHRAFVKRFLRPHEGPATARLVAALEELGGATGAPAMRSARESAPGSRKTAKAVGAVRTEIERVTAGERPVIVGPFTGEVGFELLYWIPLLRWAAAEHSGLAERMIVVSRGGIDAWLTGLGAQYVDLLSLATPTELVERRPSLKQREVTPFERELVGRVRDRLGLGEVEHLHPSVFFNFYYRMGKVDQYAFARAIRSTGRGVEGLCALFVPLAAPAPGSLADALPEEYVAVRFYFRPSFPDSSSNRAFASETIRTLTERSSVVLLNTGIELDEHRDFDPGNGVTRLDGLMSAETNLAVQTVAISRARGFVGTYGGLAYLGPFLGVPSISFSSEPEHTQPWHLALAQAVAAEPGFAACVTGRPDEASTDALLRRHVAGWDAR